MGRLAHPARLQAIDEGRATYFTGKPCNLGGVAERRVDGSDCLCAVHKAMDVERAAKNYQKNRDYRLQKQKAYAEQNSVAVKATAKRIYEADKAKRIESAAEWAAANPDSRRRIAREWAKANRANVMANTRKRQARKLNATPSWFGEFDELVMQEAYDLSRLRAEATGFKWEVDHIIPLGGRKVCGLHVAVNIQVIPMTANRKKSNRHVVA